MACNDLLFSKTRNNKYYRQHYSAPHDSNGQYDNGERCDRLSHAFDMTLSEGDAWKIGRKHARKRTQKGWGCTCLVSKRKEIPARRCTALPLGLSLPNSIHLHPHSPRQTSIHFGMTCRFDSKHRQTPPCASSTFEHAGRKSSTGRRSRNTQSCRIHGGTARPRSRRCRRLAPRTSDGR